jgi:hypothetical protein
VCQAAVQRRLGHVRNGLQQGEGHVRANHSGSLEQTLLFSRQVVDARRQHRPHGGGYLDRGQRLRQAISTPLADEYPRLYQGADTLF